MKKTQILGEHQEYMALEYPQQIKNRVCEVAITGPWLQSYALWATHQLLIFMWLSSRPLSTSLPHLCNSLFSQCDVLTGKGLLTMGGSAYFLERSLETNMGNLISTEGNKFNPQQQPICFSCSIEGIPVADAARAWLYSELAINKKPGIHKPTASSIRRYSDTLKNPIPIFSFLLLNLTGSDSRTHENRLLYRREQNFFHPRFRLARAD